MSPYGLHDFIAVSAVRYAMGRQTYIVDETCQWLRAVWPTLDPMARELIARDVTEAIKKDDAVRAMRLVSSCRPLGGDCDRAQWLAVRELWATNQQERQT